MQSFIIYLFSKYYAEHEPCFGCKKSWFRNRSKKNLMIFTYFCSEIRLWFYFHRPFCMPYIWFHRVGSFHWFVYCQSSLTKKTNFDISCFTISDCKWNNSFVHVNLWISFQSTKTLLCKNRNIWSTLEIDV